MGVVAQRLLPPHLRAPSTSLTHGPYPRSSSTSLIHGPHPQISFFKKDPSLGDHTQQGIHIKCSAPWTSQAQLSCGSPAHDPGCSPSAILNGWSFLP